MWLFVLALFVASCSDDDDPVVPQVTLSASTLEIAENATSALLIKVVADEPLSTNYTVNLKIGGSAVAGVNYQEIPATVTMTAGNMEANIFVTPINVAAIEDNKTVTLALQGGSLYELGAGNNLEVTIVDNATPASDAPVVSFGSNNEITNPYLEEEIEVVVGLSKAFDAEYTIPMTVTSDLVAGTDYELIGLDNNSITFEANKASASFKVKMKNTAVVGLDKTLTFGFANPSVTEYAVKETQNTVAINAIDPQVDFSPWFNDDNKHTYFNDDLDSRTVVWKSDLYAYNVKRWYWHEGESTWKGWGGFQKMDVSPDNSNQWKEVVNTYTKFVGAASIDIKEQERMIFQGMDLLNLSKILGSKMAKYQGADVQTTKGWLRFAATVADGTSGKVVIPAQTITIYKKKDEAFWTTKLYNADKSEYYYEYYAETFTTKADISKSAHVEPVEINIQRSEGTYDIATKTILIDVTYTCNDTDAVFNTKYGTQDGDTYTVKLKYTNNK
jgi:hypothetical protein